MSVSSLPTSLTDVKAVDDALQTGHSAAHFSGLTVDGYVVEVSTTQHTNEEQADRRTDAGLLIPSQANANVRHGLNVPTATNAPAITTTGQAKPI